MFTWPNVLFCSSTTRSRTCMQMVPLHRALCDALTQCHLFDDEGTLMPFVFSAELALSLIHI